MGTGSIKTLGTILRDLIVPGSVGQVKLKGLVPNQLGKNNWYGIGMLMLSKTPMKYEMFTNVRCFFLFCGQLACCISSAS